MCKASFALCEDYAETPDCGNEHCRFAVYTWHNTACRRGKCANAAASPHA